VRADFTERLDVDAILAEDAQRKQREATTTGRYDAGRLPLDNGDGVLDHCARENDAYGYHARLQELRQCEHAARRREVDRACSARQAVWAGTAAIRASGTLTACSACDQREAPARPTRHCVAA
jgi:hypothetical protein